MSNVPLHHVWEYTDVDRDFWRRDLEDWLPRRVFDAHTHVNEPRFRLVEPNEARLRQYWVAEISKPIGAADAARCYATVFPGREFSCLAFGHPSLDYDVEASNADLQRECVERGWHRLVVTKPDWSAEHLAEQLDLPNTLGVKPYYALIPGQDPDTRDKYIESSIFDYLTHEHLEVLDQRGAWVTLHVPRAARLGHPDNIAEIKRIRREYPRVILVIAHFGRCYTLPHAEEALPQLADDEGLYFDNSAVLNPEVHRLALKLFGPERILYGTDNPIFYMRGRRQWKGTTYVNRTSHPFFFNKDREPPEVEAEYTLYMYEALLGIKRAAEELGIGRDGIDAIFHGNARRLIDSVVGRGK
ncbi:MAG: amidohydrolase family protein [Pirellulaceae bacterium]|nr:amidohydrolase family protein [Pirellulaceae bacterium]